MEAERIDHIHFNTNNIERATHLFEGLMGKKFPVEADLSSLHGLRIAFNQFPLGFELLEVTDKGKEMGRIYADAPEGIFAICLKVPDIEKATTEMESMGYKMLLRYDQGPVKEALFDTKKAFTFFFELVEYPGEFLMDLAAEASVVVDSYSIES